jgi:outer membrane biosynthesis protein TonB
MPPLRHSASIVSVLAFSCVAGPAASRPVFPATSCAAVQPDASDTTIYDSTQVTEKAVLRVRGPAPVYPPELQISGVEGDALFSIVIAATGFVEPTSVRATGSRPEFIQGARRTVLGARYWPACVSGRPVRYHTLIPATFAIRR